MKIFDKLATRIGKEFGLKLVDFKRLYPGYWQRSSGAWVWCAHFENSILEVGSIYSATEIIKAKRISKCMLKNDIEIYIETKGE
jgi:hypothetical protein